MPRARGDNPRILLQALPLDIIRSRQNPVVKHLVKLAEQRRERHASQQTLLVGTHLVQAAHEARWPLQRLFVREGSEQRAEIAALLGARLAPATVLAVELFDAIELLPSTTGLLALTGIPEAPALRTDGCCLLLDGVQDPGNVGSILRTAAAARVDQVWLALGAADAWSPKVLRAAMGAHFVVPVIERVDPLLALAAFAGRVAITTLEHATDLYDSDLRGDLVLAMGSEGTGVSDGVYGRADLRLRIPMHPGVESLNVGAATAVCLYERVRQLRGA